MRHDPCHTHPATADTGPTDMGPVVRLQLCMPARRLRLYTPKCTQNALTLQETTGDQCTGARVRQASASPLTDSRAGAKQAQVHKKVQRLVQVQVELQ